MEHSRVLIVVSALMAQALKEIGIPSPGVTQGALIYAGYELAHGDFVTGSAIVVAVYAGSLSGAMSAYAFGLSVGTVVGERPRRFLRLQPGSLDRARERLGTGALWAVTVGRMVPGMMPPLSVVSGMSRVALPAFAAGVSLSTLAWAALLACVGAAGGRALDTRVAALNVPLLVASAAATVLVVSLVLVWWRSARTEHLDAR